MEITPQKIINDLKLDNIDSETAKQTVANIFSTLYFRVSLSIEDKLSEKDMKEALALKDAETQLLFIGRKVNGFDKIIQSEYDTLIAETKARVNNAL